MGGCASTGKAREYDFDQSVVNAHDETIKFIHGQLSMRGVQEDQPMDESFSRTHSDSDASDDLEDAMYDIGRPWAQVDSAHDTLTDSNVTVERGNVTVEREDRDFWKQLLKWEPPSVPSSVPPSVPPSVDIVSESDGDDSRETDLDELHKTIFEGHVDVSLPPKKNNICIMLASTITDYSEERDLLFNDVLPYLQRYGAKFGINVEISEMVSLYPR
jgi:hypothetical protein